MAPIQHALPSGGYLNQTVTATHAVPASGYVAQTARPSEQKVRAMLLAG